jgi:succinate dehydrogenase/fumarate reductase flavoprotein subunit
VIVIGAGIAGLVAANRAAQLGKRVEHCSGWKKHTVFNPA